ncbi:hypothetical protein F5141DRAFT_1125102 [Pisolithus sp. B1]|nr:hypothetical protein F5141DRAFT_1125102 [Pisolithus sp. B1]
MSSTSQPNTTLYINNLNDKLRKEELRLQLYALFTTYGKVIDIIASKGPKMKGQAFLVFTDLASATTAMRACEGMMFYDKPMRISYAKTKSYATARREDPDFVPPTSVHVRPEVSKIAKVTVSSVDKRQRTEDSSPDQPQPKREKSQDESEGEEMEIDEDDDKEQHSRVPAAMPASIEQPSPRLLCTNLPQEVTDDVLSVLFQQYRGFQSTHVTQVPAPNAAGAKVKMAQVFFESSELASVAKEALDGFTLKKGWQMRVAYA